jgi:hypothetical protein
MSEQLSWQPGELAEDCLFTHGPVSLVGMRMELRDAVNGVKSLTLEQYAHGLGMVLAVQETDAILATLCKGELL